MSLSLENVNVSPAFTDPLDVPIMHPRVILIDSLEYLWGLLRGQMASYFNVPGNFLRVQPELNEAIDVGKVALIPPNHVVAALFKFQHENFQLPFIKRRIFTEVFSFKPCECRVVPLKPGVSLYALNPTTRKVTPLKGTRTSFPSVSCEVHPFFLLTHACRKLFNPPPSLGLADVLFNCASSWHMEPPIEFYDGAYDGQFGRSMPFDYLYLLRQTSPVLDNVHSSSSSSSCSSSDSRPSKRSRLSMADSEAGVDIAQWVLNCAAEEFSPVPDNPISDVVARKSLHSREVARRQNQKRKRL